MKLRLIALIIFAIPALFAAEPAKKVKICREITLRKRADIWKELGKISSNDVNFADSTDFYTHFADKDFEPTLLPEEINRFFADELAKSATEASEKYPKEFFEITLPKVKKKFDEFMATKPASRFAALLIENDYPTEYAQLAAMLEKEQLEQDSKK